MNENRSPIPSRLYNAAKGGHVTGTAANASAKKLGIHYNYVTIDTIRRRLSVLRIGDNFSKYGEVKDGFSLFY